MVDKTVMIVTPFSDFGDLVRQSVNKNKSWKVNSVSTINEVANHLFEIHSLDYALLDMELGVEKVRESAFIIRDKFPGTELILISKRELPVELEDIRPWRLLKKPFVENDLLEIFNSSSYVQKNQVIDGKFKDPIENTIPAWAQNKNVIKEILINTIANLDVQEAILYADDTVLAYTNNILGSDINDCSTIVRKYLVVKDQGELLKQIQLGSNSYLLHATILAVGIILALLYNPETPYKTIRNQTKYLSTRIVNPQLSTNDSHVLPISVVTMKGDNSSQVLIKELATEAIKNFPVRMLSPRPAKKFIRKTINKIAERKEERPDRSDTLSNDLSSESKPGTAAQAPIEIDRTDLEKMWKYRAPEPDNQNSSITSEQLASNPVSDPGPAMGNKIGFSTSQSQNIEPTERNPIDNLHVENTRRQFLPAGQVSSPLNFACLLIPRIKSHSLISDLARYLDEEIPTIFLANGWRLESLIIEKQYMQWIVCIPSTIAPSNHIRIVRKDSSKMILGNFTRLSNDGLITDFWAPGHLLESGKRAIPDQEISDFIRANRQQYYPDDRIFQMPKSNFFTIN